MKIYTIVSFADADHPSEDNHYPPSTTDRLFGDSASLAWNHFAFYAIAFRTYGLARHFCSKHVTLFV